MSVDEIDNEMLIGLKFGGGDKYIMRANYQDIKDLQYVSSVVQSALQQKSNTTHMRGVKSQDV